MLALVWVVGISLAICLAGVAIALFRVVEEAESIAQALRELNRKG